MSWAKGDLVEVYDPDETVWLPGVVEDLAVIKGFDFIIVQTDAAQYQGLPLKIAMPANRAAWIRGRVETA